MAAAVSTASHEVVRFQCPEAILAFGGSSTDTGEAQSFTGERELDFVTASQFLPYGITYFGHPADRYSDGRLIIDFLSQAFGLRLLDPYFDNIAPDFRQGINFATGGANVRRVESIDVVPIYLGLQVNQAIRFYHKSLDVPSGALVPAPSSFGNLGLYFIFAGVNDICFATMTNSGVERIRDVILPEIVSNVSLAITRLYNNSTTRQFLVLGISPFGCTAFALGLGLPDLNPAYGPIGQDGCAQGINGFVKELNELLLVELESLRSQLSETTIVYADTYSIIYDAVINPSLYGFS
nr:GDSL esterase/lipase At4g01130-like [Physcomitrium patens]PNR32242.1 hypothetical protein PHYPA_026368 [Physcomitrium patens]|eukprot:XP_024359839.1 GDSL esterase/lipase At4g01130-like [Physcomitrella patens]